ncbi:MAG: IMP dehydrogenase [Methanomicrobiales archaeon]|jgi:glutamate synthase domain-containing protein 2/rubredoxin|nr:IMP dehydrogenase [Methanomicrobiales archaeon]
MARYLCNICKAHEYDSEKGVPGVVDPHTLLQDLPDSWHCPLCFSTKAHYVLIDGDEKKQDKDGDSAMIAGEEWMEDIILMASGAGSLIASMGTTLPGPRWDDILFIGSSLSRLPTPADAPVSLQAVIGAGRSAVKKPLILSLPVFVTHMSFGALSSQAKCALAHGARKAGTAIGSGEGGVLPEEVAAAGGYIYEYVPNRYSALDEVFLAASAVEIKISQAAKPGLGGQLPGKKVTKEIAAVRGREPGVGIHSPPTFPELWEMGSTAGLCELVAEMRKRAPEKPIGVKIAAGDIERDLAIIEASGADFVTIDGRPGGTGASPKTVRDYAGIPTIYAISRARRWLDEHGSTMSLIATGGFRKNADIAKALAMGADAIALGTAALVAIGCRQHRICASNRCPRGIATQDPTLTSQFDLEDGAVGLAQYLKAVAADLDLIVRMHGKRSSSELGYDDLVTMNADIATFTRIPHV